MSSDDRIPPARVVKGGETVGTDTEQMWQPSQTGDNADDHPKVIANHLRALTREMRDGFDGIGRALVALTRIDEKLDVVIDRQNVLERRQDAADAPSLPVESLPSNPSPSRASCGPARKGNDHVRSHLSARLSAVPRRRPR
jgi:hypothetical protein